MQFTSNPGEQSNKERAAVFSASRFAGEYLMQCAQIAQQSFPDAALYIVGLPIGNAADITLRALWILDICDRVACEDTRETRKLLDRYGISKPTFALHEHNERSAAEKLIECLAAGERIALVTDAGTPAVSDPGSKAVAVVRSEGYRVIPVPGASAVVTALSASGLESYSFTFVGFAPTGGKQRKALLLQLSESESAFVLYEAPHRIKDLLKELAVVLSPTRRVVVARELTKKFESFDAMTAGELAAWVQAHEPRGEYAVVVDMKPEETADISPADMKWIRAVAAELPLSRAAAIAAKVTGRKRDEIYKMLSEEKTDET